MFTGIVEELGKILDIKRGSKSARLTVGALKVLEDVKPGDSIAVNGVCLTVTEFEKSSFFIVDVMAETLEKSNLGDLKPGEYVNLERALRLQDRLGGHLVSGHIDGVGTIRRQDKVDIAIVMEVDAPPQVLKYTVKKGSVAIDGISLTVVDVGGTSLKVSLIPHTVKITTLRYKKIGDTVNLEGDIIGKYVERLLTWKDGGARDMGWIKEGLTMEFLAKNGFL